MDVSIGILKNEALAWNLPFLTHHLEHRPYFNLELASPRETEFSNYQKLCRQKHDLILLEEAYALDYLRENLNENLSPIPLIWDPDGRVEQSLTDYETKGPIFVITSLKKRDSGFLIFLPLPQSNSLAEFIPKISEFKAIKSALQRPLQSITVRVSSSEIQQLMQASIGDTLQLPFFPIQDRIPIPPSFQLLSELTFDTKSFSEWIISPNLKDLFNVTLAAGSD